MTLGEAIREREKIIGRGGFHRYDGESVSADDTMLMELDQLLDNRHQDIQDVILKGVAMDSILLTPEETAAIQQVIGGVHQVSLS